MLDLVALSFLSVQRWRLVFEALRGGRSPAQILDEQCAGSTRGQAPTPASLRDRAARALERGRAEALTPIPWTDPRTPKGFHHIVDPPPVLWLRGQHEWMEKPAVALVGSRAGSAYALAVAEKLADDLAAQGVVVVSGLARGVDAAAHRGALAAGGVTVAVLGCGADLVYPREHRRLAADVAAHGAIVSEFPPGTPPRPGFFPRRNRIISALSRAVVVVEAGEKSGSLITARFAAEQGRDVMAVPGNVLSGRNRGGHALLRDGARLVESADDVLEEIGLTVSRTPSLGGDTTHAADPIEACLYEGEPLDLDEISEQSGLAVSLLLPRLLDLELRGIVRRAGGGRFVRV